jgi:peptide/nickel transport system permease protein
VPPERRSLSAGVFAIAFETRTEMASRQMLWFVLRRLIVMAVLLIALSFCVFALLYASPGSVVEAVLGTSMRTQQRIQALKQEFHLDKPFLTQYWIWARDALRLHFGNSFQSTLPVTDEIKSRLGTSAFLAAYAYVLTMIVGCGLGVLTALKQRSVIDRGVVGAAILGFSAPGFAVGVYLLYLLAIKVHLFPVYGGGQGFWGEAYHLTLPAITLAIGSSASILKHTRAAVIGVAEQDYVTFARARGLSTRRVLFVYLLRNALIPVITVSGLLLSGFLTGAVLIEVTFSVPGIGSLLVRSATYKDLPMLQAVSLLFAVVIIVANLWADIAYIAVDPRIRLGGRSA